MGKIRSLSPHYVLRISSYFWMFTYHADFSFYLRFKIHISDCKLQFWRDVGAGQGHGQFHILFLFFVSSMFSISLCSLLGYHIHLVLNNRTTLEAFRFQRRQQFLPWEKHTIWKFMKLLSTCRAPVFRRGPDKDGFSLGKRGNLAEVSSFSSFWPEFELNLS